MQTGTVLVTGTAGFIGFHTARRLADSGVKVIGIDSSTQCADTQMYNARLSILEKNPGFSYIDGDINDANMCERLFRNYGFTHVVHLAARTGDRQSMSEPYGFAQTNIMGFINILEAVRSFPVSHFVFGSSASVYGDRHDNAPFSPSDAVVKPLSVCAVTNRASEALAYLYSRTYKLPITGLRFFNVYGEWGRRDAAYYRFTEQIIRQDTLKIYGSGEMLRDYVNIDDVSDCIISALYTPPVSSSDGSAYFVCNVGSGNAISIKDLAGMLENVIGMQTGREYLPVHPGDTVRSLADISDTERMYGYFPHIPLRDGLARFVSWYRDFVPPDNL